MNLLIQLLNNQDVKVYAGGATVATQHNLCVAVWSDRMCLAFLLRKTGISTSDQHASER